ncbi:DBH-like monooxygenase protein 1 [Bulinus truncatus]|nr:DBH-like monooxygenase protein 1 [Bulinus truncatus]
MGVLDSCIHSGVFLLASLLPGVLTFSSFQQRIPNGNIVPHPCKPNRFWAGVGHFLEGGTGCRNPFGQDFENEGKIWTEALCREDSDGDGLTNGQELGDPDCVWKENTIPSNRTSLSHPGICDPWNSLTCSSREVNHPTYHTQGEWLADACKLDQFLCPGLDATDVKTVDIRLPLGSKIPPKPATYMCQIFDLESMLPHGDYHLIATQPILDNSDLVHHIVLFGCSDDSAASEPFECGMVPSSSCLLFQSVWTVGLHGDCFHHQTGIRIGVNGYKRMAMQLHWNNPDSKSGFRDASGMKLYYTLNRRKYDAGILMTGLENFILPPNQPTVTVRNTCTSTCTSKSFDGPVWITKAWNHMHYSGKEMSIQVFRNSTFLTNLTNELNYNYATPDVVFYNERPVLLLPGDEIVTTCTYDTTSRAGSVYFGDSATDEMCYAFLSYYPRESLEYVNTFCFSYGPDVK